MCFVIFSAVGVPTCSKGWRMVALSRKRLWDNSKWDPSKAINLQIVLGQWLSGIFKPQEPSDISICRLETYLQKGSFNICCQCYFVNLNRSKSPQRSSKMTGPRYKHSLRLLDSFFGFCWCIIDNSNFSCFFDRGWWQHGGERGALYILQFYHSLPQWFLVVVPVNLYKILGFLPTWGLIDWL